MDGIVVGELNVDDAAEVAEVARLIARCMCDTTSWAYVVGKGREADLAWILERNLWLRRGMTLTARRESDAVLAGTVTCVPPGRMATSFLDKVRAGLLLVPFAIGYGTMRRLMRLGALHEQMERPYEHFFYVHMMGVLPEMQGLGVGSALMMRMLEDRVPPTMGTYLTTNSERNVRFYERLGFRTLGPCVRHESDEADKELFPSYSVYEMMRDGTEG